MRRLGWPWPMGGEGESATPMPMCTCVGLSDDDHGLMVGWVKLAAVNKGRQAGSQAGMQSFGANKTMLVGLLMHLIASHPSGMQQQDQARYLSAFMNGSPSHSASD